jgi:NarL family two-component system response regulator LiaR
MSTMQQPRIRVFVVDDHPMIRSGLAAMIRAEAGFEWVGEAGDGADAVRQCAALRPDVVLMDLMLPQMDGIDAAAQVSRQSPDTKVVILTSLVDPKQVQRAIRAGACGFVLKTASAQELVTVIRSAHAGRRMMSPEVTDAVIKAEQAGAPGGDLTAREREILALLARGQSNQAIADALAVSVTTVKFHISHILDKLHAENRTEAVLTALKHGIVAAG